MWKVYFSNTYKWKESGLIWFNLLPSIEFSMDDVNNDIGDYSFDISFEWLFWRITFTRYWGSAYKMNRD